VLPRYVGKPTVRVNEIVLHVDDKERRSRNIGLVSGHLC